MYCLLLLNGRLLVRAAWGGRRVPVPVSREAARRGLGSGAAELFSNCILRGRTLAVAFWTIVEKCISAKSVGRNGMQMMILVQERRFPRNDKWKQTAAASGLEITGSDASTEGSARKATRARVTG
jgi:hypothetical protein